MILAIIVCNIIVKRRPSAIKFGDHRMSSQSTVILSQPLDADLHDLFEHAVLLDQRLLHEFGERHPLLMIRIKQ